MSDSGWIETFEGWESCPRDSASVSTTRGNSGRRERSDREQLVRDRVTGEVVLAGLATIAVVILFAFPTGVAWFIALLVFAHVALRSLSNAVGAALGDQWGWMHHEQVVDRPSRLDRVVVGAVNGLRGVTAAPTTVDDRLFVPGSGVGPDSPIQWQTEDESG